jgi:DNA modification methylase
MGWKISTGDSRELVKRLDPQSVRTIVTSPPYFGLRDYGIDGQIGLESEVEDYVGALVEIFRHAREALKDDGTLWLNLGDSYGKGKQLMGIPWRVAFALQADGWYLRQDIIWHKPNPMPESVKDRCTKAHEYIFLLSKSQKYYFDYEAIQEDSIHYQTDKRAGKGNIKYLDGKRNGTEGQGQHAFVTINPKKNKRSVWSINVKSFREAHFATFPIDLITPCILAGSKPGDIVLDPFNGAGTTGVASIQNGRDYLGFELNPEYVAISEKRLGGINPLFAKEAI